MKKASLLGLSILAIVVASVEASAVNIQCLADRRIQVQVVNDVATVKYASNGKLILKEKIQFVRQTAAVYDTAVRIYQGPTLSLQIDTDHGRQGSAFGQDVYGSSLELPIGEAVVNLNASCQYRS